jgi:hypothetical protein
MTQINYARLLFTLLFVAAMNALLAQRATHRLGSSISFQVAGQNTAVGFVQRYVLTNAVGVIQYSVNSLPFTSVAAGQYKAYAVNYDGAQTAPTLTVGTNITAIGGACVDTSNALPIGVMDCNNTTGNISANIAGQNTGAGFTQKYALTDSVGRILQVLNTPSVSNLVSGIYNIYAVNYETATGITGLTAGQNISGVGGTCVAMSQPLGYVVCVTVTCNNTTGNITANVAGQNTGAGFTQKYILTDSLGVILQVLNTPSVSNLNSGVYKLYALNYETATGINNLSAGQNISAVSGTCFNLSLPLLYKVCRPLVEICNNQIDDDTDGKIDGEDVPDCPEPTCTNTTGTLNPTITGQNTGAGFTQRYALTDSTGKILQVLTTPSVSGLVSGKYRFYAINFETATGVTGLTVNANMSGVGGTCVNVSLPLLYKVCIGAPTEDICDNGIDDDNDGVADCNDPDCNNTTIATITTPKTIICTGGTTTLTASGGGTYLWSTGATTPAITVSDSGYYRVTVTRGTGCMDTASMRIDKPYMNALCQKTEITPGTNGAFLEARNGSTYLWSTGATTPKIWVGQTGTYSVTITAADGCQEVKTWTITAKQPVIVQCNQMPTYRLGLGKPAPYPNETFSWRSLDGVPILSYSALDTSIVVNLANTKPDSMYRFIQIATRYGLQDTDCIALKILDCNVKPTVVVTPKTVVEDTPTQICLPVTDPNVGQNHNAVVSCTPQHGTAGTPSVLNGQVCFTYTPILNYNGVDTVCLIVCDNDPNRPKCDTVKVPITVTPVNDSPVLVIPKPVPVAPETPTLICGTVTDPDAGQTHTTTIICGPSNGTATPQTIVGGQVCINYTPNIGFSGADSICVVVCDNGSPSLCDTVKVQIVVLPKPQAINDFATTLKNTPVSSSVATNDNPNGYAVTFTPISTTPNGTLLMNSDGTYTFTPNPTFVGQVDYFYKICTATNLCDTAKLVITVFQSTNANDRPVANDDVIQTLKNTPVSGTVSGNDIDPDGDALLVNPTPVVPPTKGTVVLNPNGSYTYTPNLNFVGKDSFEYVICDPSNLCDVAKVVIYVGDDQNGTANDHPLANDDAYSTNMGVAVTGTMKPNDTDPNGNNLVYETTPVANPTNGMVTIQSNGTFTYTPTAGFWGVDKFTYKVCDDGAPSLCDTATVFIVVPNRPLSVTDSVVVTIPVDSTRTFCTPITDLDLGDVFAVQLICNPQNGTATPSVSNGSVCLTYKSNAGYLGKDSVCVRVCDQAGNCDTVKFKITVEPTCITVTLNVLLEGPYSTATGRMSTILNQRGLLPGQTPIGVFATPTPAGQPFNVAPWNYNGTEGDGMTSYPATVVDWVLVSLRTSTAVSSTVFRCAALLHNDGRITFTKSCVTMPLGNFYIVIEHRNHMGTMSPTMVSTANGTLNFDFTTGDSFVNTNPPSFGQKAMSDGKWVQYSGDGRKDTQTANYDINFFDSQLWKTESGIFDQYRYGDFNMDADVNFSDSQLWKRNNGKYSAVPH